jgi:hypothetical protein
MEKTIINFIKFNLKGIEYLLVFIIIIFTYSFFNKNIFENKNPIFHIIIILYLYIVCITLAIIFKLSKKFKLGISYLFFILLVTESLLCISVYNPFISNLLGRFQKNVYYYNYPNIYHIPTPYFHFTTNKGEYTFERKYNSLGLSDYEWDTTKKNTIRILCLGDSYTEGDGAIADSSYVSILRKTLKNKYSNIELMNAGNCGTDPFFNFKLYEDKLQKYHPDIIIQELSYYDLYSDITIRGGRERFINNSTVQYRSVPKWEKLYAYSYIFRILIHSIGGYNIQLIREDEMPKIINDCKLKTVELFKNYKELTSKNNTDLITFTFPVFNQLSNLDNNEFHLEMNNEFSKFNLKFYNLQPCYDDEIKANYTDPQDYYWKIDGHHNAKGYEMMAKCLEEIVTPLIEKRIENQNTLVN